MGIKARWTCNMQFEGISDGHKVIMDAAKKHGGMDTGPAPMDVVLLGLVGCTGMDVIAILRKMKQDFTDVEVEITDIMRADEHPRVYTKIDMVFRIKGKDLDEEKVKKAVDLSQNKYCSVSAMLKHTALINYTVEIENV